MNDRKEQSKKNTFLRALSHGCFFLGGAAEAVVGEVHVPTNQKASRAMAILKEVGLAYIAKLRPRDLLVHPCNRGGQMVNGFDVAAKGQAICAVGWDINKIREPVCVELPFDAVKKEEITEANTKLADQSNGMLAKPFGKERCCSISASHTTSFLRALEAGCTFGTEQLSLEQLQAKGDDLGQLLQEGWDWTVISAKVEEEIPSLPSLLQQAYNSHLVQKTPLQPNHVVFGVPDVFFLLFIGNQFR